MEWKKVKTILICVLFVVNAFLAVNYLSLGLQKKTAGEEAVRSAVSILLENGISLSPDIIPEEKHMIACEGERNDRAEAEAALIFTGVMDAHRPGGGIVGYSSESGTAIFRTGGVFSAQVLNVETPQTPALAVDALTGMLRDTEFDVSGGLRQQKAADGGYSVECAQWMSSFEVFNGRIKAEFSGDNTLTLTGKWAPLSGLSPLPDRVKPTADLLLSLQGCLSDAGIRSGVVMLIEDGYLITAPSAERIRLSPVWKVRIAGETFYLDKISGAFVLPEG